MIRLAGQGEAVYSGAVFDQVARAIAALESHADPAVRDAAHVVLQGIDAMHRDGVTRLADALKAIGGDAAIEQLRSDPAVSQLLVAYGVVPADRPDPAPSTVDTRELDVVPTHQPAVPAEPRPTEYRPVFLDALSATDLPPGTLRSVTVNDTSILLANIDGQIHALRNHCGESPLPLEFGRLRGGELICPWHGCRYDVKSGRRIDAEGRALQVFAVALDRGRIQVALEVLPVQRR